MLVNLVIIIIELFFEGLSEIEMEMERQIYQDLASTTTDDTAGMLLMV